VYVDRTYRSNLVSELETFEIKIKETDLQISVKAGSVNKEVLEKLSRHIFLLRNELEDYIARDPDFSMSLQPYFVKPEAPLIAQEMAKWSLVAGVGPMAAVAGGFAEFVGRYLTAYSSEVIVENGGDIFLLSKQTRTIGVFAGGSPFSNRLGLKINPQHTPLGICTSSGTVGPSLSFGRADAAIIVAKPAFLADALATAVGNRVKTPDDFQEAINFARKIKGVKGIVLIIGDQMAAWGDIKLAPINQLRKKEKK